MSRTYVDDVSPICYLLHAYYTIYDVKRSSSSFKDNLFFGAKNKNWLVRAKNKKNRKDRITYVDNW